MKFKNALKVTLVVVTASLLISCGGDGLFGYRLFGYDDCESEIKDMISRNGNPNDTDSYASDDYQSTTYWYWCKGISYTFTQGKSVGDCKSSTYTFSPICY